jgi:hypothetical protein
MLPERIRILSGFTQLTTELGLHKSVLSGEAEGARARSDDWCGHGLFLWWHAVTTHDPRGRFSPNVRAAAATGRGGRRRPAGTPDTQWTEFQQHFQTASSSSAPADARTGQAGCVVLGHGAVSET